MNARIEVATDKILLRLYFKSITILISQHREYKPRWLCKELLAHDNTRLILVFHQDHYYIVISTIPSS